MLPFTEKKIRESIRNYRIHTSLSEQQAAFAVLIAFVKEYIKYNPGHDPRLYNILDSNNFDYFISNNVLNFSISEFLFYSLDFKSLNEDDFIDTSTLLINISYYENHENILSAKIYEALSDIIKPEFFSRIFCPLTYTGQEFIHLNKANRDKNLKFYGYCNDSFSLKITELNLLINNITDYELNIIEKDYFLEGNIYPRYFNETIDIAISAVSFHDIFYRRGEFVKRNSNIIPSIEYAIIEALLAIASKVLVVIPDTTLYISQGKYLREKYINRSWIKRVISLPSKFTTYAHGRSLNLKLSVIEFDKNSLNKYGIEFSILGQDDNTITINNSELADNEFSLLSRRYIKNHEFNKIASKVYYPILPLKVIIKSNFIGKHYSLDFTNKQPASYTNLPYIRAIDLTRNSTSIYLDIKNIGKKIAVEHAREIVDYSAIIISLIGRELKPVYFVYAGVPIIIGPDVMVMEMNSDINVEYIVTQLYSNFVKIQVESLSVGSAITRIKRADALNIKIIIPPIEEQYRQVSELSIFISEKSIAQEKVVRAEEQINNTEYEVISNINHSLKNKLGVIINDFNTMLAFLKRKERVGSDLNLSEAVRPAFEGEDPLTIDTIGSIADRIKENLFNASNVFRNAEKLQNTKLNLERVNLVDYFLNIVKNQYVGSNYTLNINIATNEKLICLLDKETFKDVIENLVENAKKHGFTEINKHYHINFVLSKIVSYENESSESYARILYMNDGRGFASGFTFDEFKHFLSKATKSQGAGIGGYVINRIIELHNGKLNLLKVSEDGLNAYPVQFEILLPIEK